MELAPWRTAFNTKSFPSLWVLRIDFSSHQSETEEGESNCEELRQQSVLIYQYLQTHVRPQCVVRMALRHLPATWLRVLAGVGRPQSGPSLWRGGRLQSFSKETLTHS